MNQVESSSGKSCFPKEFNYSLECLDHIFPLSLFFFPSVGERVAGDGRSLDLGLRTNKNQSLLMKVKEEVKKRA